MEERRCSVGRAFAFSLTQYNLACHASRFWDRLGMVGIVVVYRRVWDDTAFCLRFGTCFLRSTVVSSRHSGGAGRHWFPAQTPSLDKPPAFLPLPSSHPFYPFCTHYLTPGTLVAGCCSSMNIVAHVALSSYFPYWFALPSDSWGS